MYLQQGFRATPQDFNFNAEKDRQTSVHCHLVIMVSDNATCPSLTFFDCTAGGEFAEFARPPT
jgi:hypothetical protein